MKGLDTNVLARYILQDDSKQSRKATHFIETECSLEAPAFISGVVLCELVWVLESAYNYPKSSIALVIEKILRTRQFHIHQPEIIWQSLYGYQNERADFSDNFIANFNLESGCTHTVTFDKRAARLKSFKHLDH